MKKETFKDMFVTKIQALYDIENELLEALPKMHEEASDPMLKDALQEHLGQTKEQAKRLEQIFDLVGEDKEKLKVEGIRGIIKDGEWMMKKMDEGDKRDLAIINGGRQVEHYEMAIYMEAQEMAEMMADEGVSSLLETSLEEEQQAEEKLSELGTQIAERINDDADEDEEEV